MIIAWTRVTCVKRRGRGNPNSQMTIPWRVMPDDQISRQGAENRLLDMCPRDFPKHTTFEPKKALTSIVVEKAMVGSNSINFDWNCEDPRPSLDLRLGLEEIQEHL
jgi:hypothetical protein